MEDLLEFLDNLLDEALIRGDNTLAQNVVNLLVTLGYDP